MVSRRIYRDNKRFLILLTYFIVLCDAVLNINPIEVGFRCAFKSHSRGFLNASHRKEVITRPSCHTEFRNECSDYFDDAEEIVPTHTTCKKDSICHNSSSVTKTSNQSSASRGKNTRPSRGGGAAAPSLTFYENMICGAVSRSIAQVCTHPANTMKTLLQSNRQSANTLTLKTLAKPSNMKMLTRGAGAQFIMSIPHGAVNFAVLEYVRRKMNNFVMESSWASGIAETTAAYGPAMDFMSSAIATICCSVVSTPQMMVVDNIMAGTYKNLPSAIIGLSKDRGIAGFYGGWWPGLVGKIPSYALTWTLFQQLKLAQLRICNRPPKDLENSIMGCMASTATVCIMIPMDTIKTRLVTQMNYPDLVPYKGIIDCARRIAKEEGIQTFYRGLPPRLISVVPMIGIQFGVYEFVKKAMITRRTGAFQVRDMHKMEEIMMEVSADDEQPFPSPHIEDRHPKEVGKQKSQKMPIRRR